MCTHCRRKSLANPLSVVSIVVMEELERVAKSAWLAGMWDGEGSVGIGLDRKMYRVRWLSFRPALQLSMTCEETVMTILSLLREFGAHGAAYTYQEKDPTKHKNAWIIRVVRLLDIRKICETILPYAVTKRERLVLMLDYVNSRLEKSQILDGKVVRGGDRSQIGFSDHETKIALKMRCLNKRGPGTKDMVWVEDLRKKMRM